MSTRSFRVVTARLIPRVGRPKLALLFVTCILAGCGGRGHENVQLVRVSGAGFSFWAPAGWSVRHAGNRTSAVHGPELVQVATFPLERPYTDGLFRRVEPELAARMHAVARETGGSLSPAATVRVAGIRSHSYEVAGGGHVDEYTFLLRGRREFQLLCRRRSAGSDEVCRRLVATFRLS